MKTLLSAQQIQTGVVDLARRLTAHYGETPLTIIGVLNGSLVFLADLIRQLKMPLRIGMMQAQSYRGAVTERGSLSLNLSDLPDISGRHVLLLDDIFDTGHTLAATLAELRKLQPASLLTVVLLTKLGRQEIDLRPDFTVFEIPNVFVVGYGLDYNDQYRNLPYVAELEPEEI